MKFKEPEIPKGYKPIETKGGLITLQKVKQVPKVKEVVKVKKPTQKSVPKEWMGVYDILGESVAISQKVTPKVIQKQLQSSDSLLNPQIARLEQPLTMKSSQNFFYGLAQKQKSQTRLVTSYVSGQGTSLAIKQRQRQLQGQQQKLKQEEELQLKQTQMFFPMLTQGQKTKVTQKITQRQLQRQFQRTKLQRTPVQFLTQEKKQLPKKEPKILVQGFEVYVKRKGKWVKVKEKPLPKYQAVKLGAKITRTSLAASFKVRESKKKIPYERGEFEPSPMIFRSYKIVKGRRVPLTDEYIQRRGKRLGTRTEVREIQMTRRNNLWR